jgi:molecular chaperone DnaK (HSP70)
VALITVQEQLFEVKAMHGDTTLGGIDVVRRLMDYCLHDFGEKQTSQVFQNVFALE